MINQAKWEIICFNCTEVKHAPTRENNKRMISSASTCLSLQGLQLINTARGATQLLASDSTGFCLLDTDKLDLAVALTLLASCRGSPFLLVGLNLSVLNSCTRLFLKPLFAYRVNKRNE